MQLTRPAPMHRYLASAALAGVGGAMAMAMVAMVASVTYQHHGLFTPVFHIAALFGSAKAMTTSAHEAMLGHRFWFTPGAAATGLLVHVMTGVFYGLVFAAVAPIVPRRAMIPAGMLFGLAVFGLSAFVDLPAAAAVTGAGSVIGHMARIVGYPTFAVEHVVFGAVTAGLFRWRTTSTAPDDRRSPAGRATLAA